MRAELRRWIERRTGLETAAKTFLYEQIPASCGWPQVFGSVAAFLFLTQAFTGILLALNYAPAPGDAYYSVRYIVTEAAGGRLIRGLHHWGASLLVVVVVLHMLQVFLFGAYRKPREATWLAGVVLLLFTLAYGLTGYLLPGDNRAYWGTVVTTGIAGKWPLIGTYFARFLGSEGGAVGAVSFARFYSLHVLVLPPLTALLIVFHIYLVRKHGITPLPADSGETKPFFPGQALKDTLAIFAAFAALFLMAAFVQVPLERIADPTDASYVPRPDWYFLFLFEILKLFEGPLDVLGTTVLPLLAIFALLAVPFLDRGRIRKVTERTAAIGVASLALLGWAALTVAATATGPGASASADAGPRDWRQLSPEELAGLGWFQQEQCSACHNLGHGPAKLGPDLGAGATRRTAAWMAAHFQRPSAMIPGSAMPPAQLGEPERSALAAFLLKVNPRNARALEAAPAFAVEGALLYESQRCAKCHTVNGAGNSMGTSLNGVAERRTRDWVEKHFLDPQALSPGTKMHAYHFSPDEMNRIVSYLFALP